MKKSFLILIILFFALPLAAAFSFPNIPIIGDKPAPSITVEPNDPLILQGSPTIISLDLSQEVSAPQMIVSVDKGEIISASGRKLSFTKKNQKEIVLKSNEKIYSHHKTQIKLRAPEDAKGDISINLELKSENRKTAHKEIRVEILGTSEGGKKILIRQSQAKADLAGTMANMYDSLILDSEQIEKIQKEGLIDGVSEVTKLQYTMSKSSAYDAVKMTYETSTGKGPRSELEQIVDSMMIDYMQQGQYIGSKIPIENTAGNLEDIDKQYQNIVEALRDGERSELIEIYSENLENDIDQALRSQNDILADTGNLGKTTKTFLFNEEVQADEKLKILKSPKPDIKFRGYSSEEQKKLSKLETGEVTNLIFEVKNKGGLAKQGYFSISHSQNVEIKDVNQISGDDEINVYRSKIGDTIYSSSGKIEAEYPLLDVMESYDPSESNTYELELRRKSDGNVWMKYRAAMKPEIEMDDGFYRYPDEGVEDQQGRKALEIRYEEENKGVDAEFDYLPESPSVGQDVVLRCQTEGTCRWDVDNDGEIEEEGNIHNFKIEKDKEVKLLVERGGKSDSVVKEIKVEASAFKVRDESEHICVKDPDGLEVIQSYQSIVKCLESLQEDPSEGENGSLIFEENFEDGLGNWKNIHGDGGKIVEKEGEKALWLYEGPGSRDSVDNYLRYELSEQVRPEVIEFKILQESLCDSYCRSNEIMFKPESEIGSGTKNENNLIELDFKHRNIGNGQKVTVNNGAENNLESNPFDSSWKTFRLELDWEKERIEVLRIDGEKVGENFKFKGDVDGIKAIDINRGYYASEPIWVSEVKLFDGGSSNGGEVNETEEESEDELLSYTFDEGLQGWNLDNKYSKSHSINEDTYGEWSEKYGGSIRKRIKGGPGGLDLWREVDQTLPAGTTIEVKYNSDDIQGEPGGPALQVRYPERDNVRLENENQNTGQDGYLSGEIPDELPEGGVINIHDVVWPGSYNIYITEISASNSKN